MSVDAFDLVVLGSGPAGEKGAAQAAYFGTRVALVEKAEHLGGAGVNKVTDFNPYRTGTNNQTIVTAGKDTYLSYPGVALTTATAGDESLFYSWNVGGGVRLGRFFIESQYKSINTNGASSNHIPIVVGLNF